MPDRFADASHTPREPWRDPALLEGAGSIERDYRTAVVAAVARHVQEEGPHQARPDPHRARQFMPFAALKGYGTLTSAQEDAAAQGFQPDAHEEPT